MTAPRLTLSDAYRDLGAIVQAMLNRGGEHDSVTLKLNAKGETPASAKRQGVYDGLHAAVLCDQHANSPDPCLSEQAALRRRATKQTGYSRAAA